MLWFGVVIIAGVVGAAFAEILSGAVRSLADHPRRLAYLPPLALLAVVGWRGGWTQAVLCVISFLGAYVLFWRHVGGRAFGWLRHHSLADRRRAQGELARLARAALLVRAVLSSGLALALVLLLPAAIGVALTIADALVAERLPTTDDFVTGAVGLAFACVFVVLALRFAAAPSSRRESCSLFRRSHSPRRRS